MAFGKVNKLDSVVISRKLNKEKIKMEYSEEELVNSGIVILINDFKTDRIAIAQVGIIIDHNNNIINITVRLGIGMENNSHLNAFQND